VPANLQQLISVRSRLVEEVRAYLRERAAWAAALPYYYPARLQGDADGRTGFDDVRQLVQVRKDQKDRPRGAEPPVEGRNPYDVIRSRPEHLDRDYLSHEREPEPPIPWDDTAGEQFHRAVILGDPGFGKTWLLRFELRRLARRALEQLEDRSVRVEDIVFPLFLRLPEICESRAPLDELLLAQAGQGRSEAFRQFVRARLQSPQGVVLLDAWDEVPQTGELGDLRTPLGRRIEAFARAFPQPRILLTSRFVEFHESPVPGAQELELLAFETAQMKSVIRVWFADTPERATLLGLLADHRQVHGLARIPLMLTLLCRVWQEDLDDAGASAFTLTTNRCELYDRCLQGLLWKWPREDKTEHRPRRNEAYGRAVQDLLQYVAFQLVDEGRQQFDESLLSELMAGFLGRLGNSHPLHGKPADTLIAEMKEDGLLTIAIKRRDSSLMFLHRTFQEYLAACHLVQAVGRTRRPRETYDHTRLPVEAFPSRLVAVVRDQWDVWREVAPLAGAELAQRAEPRAWELIGALCPAECDDAAKQRASDADYRLAWLAGEIVLENQLNAERGMRSAEGRARHSVRAGRRAEDSPPYHEGELLERIKSWLAALGDFQPFRARNRARAGVVLGRLGDPRKGVGLFTTGPAQRLPEMDWVRITTPESGFIMGGEESFEGGRRFQCHFLDGPAGEYGISRYLVTNRQYEVFVSQGGYVQEQWWTQAGWAWKVRENITGPDRDPRYYWPVFLTPNHPVVGISYYEAVAFCRWLTHRLHQAGTLPDNLEISLPTEAQWERAARGLQGALYQDGDRTEGLGERCNCGMSDIGATSAVGMFPVEPGICEARDMMGNVWEWCLTKWADSYQDYRPDDDWEGDSARVVRGGGWFNGHPDYLSSTFRYRCDPGFRSGDYGFRVVRVGASAQ
jgi:formylglycine-generating enzyme required for sulfatase activity